MGENEESKSPEEERSENILSNEKLIALVKEKIAEKNEVIKEQQIQIQELQDKIASTEEEINSLMQGAKDREDLVKQLSEILE